MFHCCCTNEAEVVEEFPSSLFDVQSAFETRIEEAQLVEPPKPSPPPPRAQTFELALDKGQDELGLIFDLRADTLMITSVNDGAVQKYNEASAATAQVRVHDFILEVNGITDAEKMVKELSTKAQLSMRVQHVEPFRATVRKGGRTLGVRLAHHDKSSTICITEVGPGAVEDYNQTASE